MLVMNLWKIIPENKNWTISKNIVYVNYIVKIPMLVKQGDDIFVYLDIKIAKDVLSLVKILDSHNIDFLFKSTLIFFDHKFSEEEFHRLNLKQYIKNICDAKFFDGFQKIGFDYTKNLANYLAKYECYDIFKMVYEKEKKTILHISYDYWINKNIYDFKREEVRNYISALEREVKINLLF